MRVNSTEPRTVSKPSSGSRRPEKPYEGFLMFAHASGQWAKKIRGDLHYFGSFRNDLDGTEALKRFNKDWPYLKDGKQAPEVDVSDGCTLRVVANQFLDGKERMLKAGELSYQMFRDYCGVCSFLIDHFGKERRVDDLRPEISENSGPS